MLKIYGTNFKKTWIEIEQRKKISLNNIPENNNNKIEQIPQTS